VLLKAPQTRWERGHPGFRYNEKRKFEEGGKNSGQQTSIHYSAEGRRTFGLTGRKTLPPREMIKGG